MVEFDLTVGFCFGGYCPMHRGHLDAIMRAKKENDKCIVAVCGYDNEPRSLDINLPLNKRFQLVKEFFKEDEQIEVICINDTELGIDESMSDNNWHVWWEAVKKQFEFNIDNYTYITNGYKPVFYVAEPFYKEKIESILHIDAVLLEKELPISGTLIRRNPIKYWNYIIPTYKPYLTKNILICGTASEGKTTLVKDIHRYFGLPYTEEFGRIYMAERNMLDTDLTVEDFKEFLMGQYHYIKDAQNYPANTGVTIHDTDNLITLMYANAYINDDNINISQEDYNTLYQLAKCLQSGITWNKIFLIKPHATFVNDGTRYMMQSGIDERMKNYNCLVKLLTEFGLMDKVTILNGTYLEHFNIVKSYINELYNN